MSNRVVYLILVVLLFSGGLAQAANIDFNSVNPVGIIQMGDNYNQVTLHDSATVTMTGGTAQSVLSYNSSTFQLQSGTVSGFISVYNTSNLTMSGGLIGSLQVYDSSITTITGGYITGSLAIYGTGTAMVHIYGKNLNSTLHNGGGWLITGNWNDTINSPFAIWYRASYSSPMPGSSDSHIVLHTIPEPTTLFLLGLGMVLVRKKMSK